MLLFSLLLLLIVISSITRPISRRVRLSGSNVILTDTNRALFVRANFIIIMKERAEENGFLIYARVPNDIMSIIIAIGQDCHSL